MRRPIVDAQSNLLSLINIVEEMGVPAQAAVLGAVIYLVSQWEKDNLADENAEVFRYRIRLLSPAGDQVGTSNEMEQTVGNDRLRSMVGLRGLPLKEEGYYHWVIEVDETGPGQSVHGSHCW